MKQATDERAERARERMSGHTRSKKAQRERREREEATAMLRLALQYRYGCDPVALLRRPEVTLH